MTEIEKRILENQEIMMHSLSVLLVKCRDSMDMNLIHTNNDLMDCYHETRRILGKKSIDRYRYGVGKDIHGIK